MILQPNTLFHNRYYLQELKGRGSFGEVWLARDQQLDTDVAIKVYIALDSRGVEDFKTEFKTASGLNHPYLLHAYHFEIYEDHPYLIMPYCPGSAVNYLGRMDETTAWQFIHDVASGLEYLHGMGIVHHDIKPDNILVDENDHFLITDFGISVKFRSTLRRNSSRQVQSEQTGGTIPYMAPELFTEQAEAVNASDIWAFGTTLFELLSGELPFFGQGGTMQNNGAKIPELKGDYSDSLKQVVRMCLAKESWDRPSAKQLVEYASMALEGNRNIFPKNKTDKDKKSKKSKKIALLVTLLVLVIAGTGAGVGFIFHQREARHQEELDQKATLVRQQQINEEYRALVEECLRLTLEGSNATPQPLLDAKNKMEELKSFEDKNRVDLEKTVADSINDLLKIRLKDAATVWAEAAKQQANADEDVKALEFYQLSLRLYELPGVKEECQKLSEKVSVILNQ